MLAVWREWGLAEILREAWERGIVLCGQSAGSICWFEAGVTDSLAGDLTAIACLGFLPESNCPHYDGEKTRRPAYHRLVADGLLGDGYAADDGVGLHYVGDSLRAAVSARAGATAYRVVRKADGTVRETALEAVAVRVLGQWPNKSRRRRRRFAATGRFDADRNCGQRSTDRRHLHERGAVLVRRERDARRDGLCAAGERPHLKDLAGPELRQRVHRDVHVAVACDDCRRP